MGIFFHYIIFFVKVGRIFFEILNSIRNCIFALGNVKCNVFPFNALVHYDAIIWCIKMNKHYNNMFEVVL